MRSSLDPTVAIDLGSGSEATRRALYDAVVEILFSPTAEEIRQAQANDEWWNPYTAAESQLEIHHLWGRWFATWLSLDQPQDTPEAERREVVRITAAPGQPFGIQLLEI